MRGSLRLRHQSGCLAKGKGKNRDPRACRCAPTVEVRFGGLGIERTVGYLDKGWRARDLDEFQGELRHMREQLLAGRAPRPKRIVTLNDYAVGWFAQLHAAVKLGQVSPLTYNQYEGEWRRWLAPRFGRLPLGAVDVAAANAYIADSLDGGAAESTAKNSLTCLSGMLTDAVAEGLIAANPLRSPRRGRHGGRRIGVDLTVRRTPPKHLELDEALALLAVVPDEHLGLPLAAMTHGLRRNEVLGLHWEWLDWGARTLDLRGQLQWLHGRPRTDWEIRTCKFKSNRLLPLYSGFATLLGRRREAEGLVFPAPGSNGLPWNARACRPRPSSRPRTRRQASAGRASSGTRCATRTRRCSARAASNSTRSSCSWATRSPAPPASTSTSCARRSTRSTSSWTRRSATRCALASAVVRRAAWRRLRPMPHRCGRVASDVARLQAVYYRAVDGGEPVREFIVGLDAKRRLALRKQIGRLNLLTAEMPHLPFPHSSQVEGELRELRCHFGSEHYRVLYRRSENLLVLLVAFRKTSAQIPAGEIATANDRWDEFRRRMDADPRRPPRAAGHDAP